MYSTLYSRKKFRSWGEGSEREHGGGGVWEKMLID